MEVLIIAALLLNGITIHIGVNIARPRTTRHATVSIIHRGDIVRNGAAVSICPTRVIEIIELKVSSLPCSRRDATRRKGTRNATTLATKADEKRKGTGAKLRYGLSFIALTNLINNFETGLPTPAN